ncbi:12339_t:CDS:2, partial [Dentiscutata heterogama]
IGDTSNFHKNLTSQLDSIININDINNAPNENNDILNVKYKELYSFSCKEIVQMDDANKNSKVMQVDNGGDFEDKDHEENEEIMQEVEDHKESKAIMQIDNVNKNNKVAQVDNGSDVEGEGHKEGDGESKDHNKGNEKGDNEEDDEGDKESNEGSDKDKNEDEDNDDERNIKRQRIATKTSKRVNCPSIPTFLQEVSPDIINQCIILASITQDINFNKIEINLTKKIATLKNNRGEIVLEPINPIEIRKSIINIKFPKFERVSKKQVSQDPYSYLGYFASFQPTKKKEILTGNKLKVSKQFHELLAFESELTIIALFYNKNLFIKKDDYYKSLLNYLKELSILHKTSIVQFNPAQINSGLALEYENLVLSNSDDNLNLQDQIMLLRHMPQLSQDLKVNNLSKNDSLEKKVEIFLILMSTCYQSIFDCNITTYNIEVSHRMSLRFLYKFEIAYNYLTDWINKYTTREKGTLCATQVRALLTGKESLYDMFNINKSDNSFNIKHVIDKNISSKKPTTFITAGPRLHQLLKALNNNWVLLDIIDDVSITWLESMRKDE